MRAAVLLLISVAIVACGEGEVPAGDSAVAATQPSAAPPSSGVNAAPPASPSTDSAMQVMPGSPAPITGTIFEVRMVGDASGYRFEPSQIKARAGDAVRFVLISGGPHEIEFNLEAVPAESRDQLQVNMPNSAAGRSPLLAAEQETWTVSLGSLRPGLYPFVSRPRLPQGMKGTIEIQ